MNILAGTGTESQESVCALTLVNLTLVNFWLPFFSSFDQWASCAKKMEHSLVVSQVLDNSSTHVLPDGAAACMWEVDGFNLCGVKMSHTNAVFALANTTSETQAMDAGIIKCMKGKARKMFVQWVLERMESDEHVTADKLKPDIRQAMSHRYAWRDVRKQTIVNCWNQLAFCQLLSRLHQQ